MVIKVLNFEKIRKELENVGKGFVRLPIKALEDKRLSRSAIIVLARLIDKADRDSCVLSFRQIATLAKVSERSARNAVKELEECDYITVIRHEGGKNEYIQNDILPPKKRTNEEQGEQKPKIDEESLLNMWEEAGVLERIRTEGVS